MPTYKELLLSNSTLPQVGIYTLAEHLAARNVTITANEIGGFVITQEEEEIVIKTSPYSLTIASSTFTLDVTPSILYPVIKVQEQLNIVISQDC